MMIQPKHPLFQKCLAYLESLPNLQATIHAEPYLSDVVLADGELIINTASKTVHYVCEIKTGLTSDVIDQAHEYVSNLGKRLEHGTRPLLITRGLSRLVVDQLIRRNVEFVDVDGSVYLNSPEMYILVRNQVSRENVSKSLEITAAALQVIYALLSQPGLNKDKEYFLYQGISYISGVSPKTAQDTLKKLQKLDYVKNRGGRYSLIDYVKLFERWELGYCERLRPKLFLGTFSHIKKLEFLEVKEKINECAEDCDYLVGGELAASIMTDYIRPISTTIHVKNKSHSRQIAVKLKLKPDPDGSITFLQTFGEIKYQKNVFGEHFSNIANPLLIHAELVQSGNSRLKETAQLIYDKYIEELAQQDDWL